MWLGSRRHRCPVEKTIDQIGRLILGQGPGGSAGVPDARDERIFNIGALQVYRAQHSSSGTLSDYWYRTAKGKVDHWESIPPVPVAAFRDVPIAHKAPEAVYRTSGTSQGAGRRGTHLVCSVKLYRAAARYGYRRHLFAGAGELDLVSLVPKPAHAPDSSLSAMVGFIAEEPEVVRVTWAHHPERGILANAVREAATVRRPVLLVATSLALNALLEALGDDVARLPAGSRLMETGGYKGREVEVSPAEQARRVEARLGVPPSHVVNEYGMTELLSQAYRGIAGRVSPDDVHRFPPWVRTRALDADTLLPLASGREGLLAHFDLANVGSVCYVLTEDWGATTPDGGVRLLGRAPGAEMRGCSLAAEEFLRIAGPDRFDEHDILDEGW